LPGCHLTDGQTKFPRNPHFTAKTAHNASKELALLPTLLKNFSFDDQALRQLFLRFLTGLVAEFPEEAYSVSDYQAPSG